VRCDPNNPTSVANLPATRTGETTSDNNPALGVLPGGHSRKHRLPPQLRGVGHDGDVLLMLAEDSLPFGFGLLERELAVQEAMRKIAVRLLVPRRWWAR
jgi:hypothetical protein